MPQRAVRADILGGQSLIGPDGHVEQKRRLQQFPEGGLGAQCLAQTGHGFTEPVRVVLGLCASQGLDEQRRAEGQSQIQCFVVGGAAGDDQRQQSVGGVEGVDRSGAGGPPAQGDLV